VTVPLRRLPTALGVLVVAFAPYERRPEVGSVRLVRGMAQQLAYRWPNGQVLLDDAGTAALLWSRPGGPPSPLLRRAAGVLAAVAVGLALVVVANGLLLLPLAGLLCLLGLGAYVQGVALAVVGLRLALTAGCAVRAYRHSLGVERRLPAATGARIRVDYLGAAPAGRGHGGRLLGRLLLVADELDAEVVLDCDRGLTPFYRRHGFHLVDGHLRHGPEVMVRRRRSERGRAVSPAVPGPVAGRGSVGRPGRARPVARR
jgi:hypothetical protein